MIFWCGVGAGGRRFESCLPELVLEGREFPAGPDQAPPDESRIPDQLIQKSKNKHFDPINIASGGVQSLRKIPGSGLYRSSENTHAL